MLPRDFNLWTWATTCTQRATPELLKAFIADLTTELVAPRLAAYQRACETVALGRVEWAQRRHDADFRLAQKHARQARRLAQNELRVLARAVKLARLAVEYRQLNRPSPAPHALPAYLLSHAVRMPVETIAGVALLPAYARRLRFAQQCMTVEQSQMARLVLQRHESLFMPIAGLTPQAEDEQVNREQLYRKILYAVKLTANEARLLDTLFHPST